MQLSSKQKVMSTLRNNSKGGAPVSVVEFEDFHEDATEQTQVVLNDDKSEETPKNMESTSDVEVLIRDTESHEKREVKAKTTANVYINGTEISVVVSGFYLGQIGADGKVSKSRNGTCDVCSQNCYSSSDEENSTDTFKIEEVDTDSHAHVDLFKRETTCYKMSYSVMPDIPKRGCMNTSRCDSRRTKLKELQRTGDFVGHEQMVEKEMGKSRLAADPDMVASLQIERAVALYFQNNIKYAKIILKLVVKQEQKLKNPGILVGRALNLLTAIYNRQGKFGNAMQCVERANTCLEGQDSPDDKAELHHSYGALITAMPASTQPDTSRATKKEAYEVYERAVDTANNKFKEYLHVKMAELLLESRSKAERTVTLLSKEEVLKAKKHLDFVEGKNLSLGTRIKFLLLRSDQFLYEGKVAMAMEKAQEANGLIQRHGFQLESVPAKNRIEYLSVMQKQDYGNGLEISEYCCTNDDTTDNESAHSE